MSQKEIISYLKEQPIRISVFGEDTGFPLWDNYNYILGADNTYVITDWGDCYTPSECDVDFGDVNGDGVIDILDVVAGISIILSS